MPPYIPGGGTCPPTGIRTASSLASSLGTMSSKKSKTSVLVMAAAMSFRCKVLRLLSSECIHDRSVSSKMKSSQAFAKSTGASALIIRTSSSDFIIFFILARGSWWFLKTEVSVGTSFTSSIWESQKLLSVWLISPQLAPTLFLPSFRPVCKDDGDDALARSVAASMRGAPRHKRTALGSWARASQVLLFCWARASKQAPRRK
mmetsp:Transcript_18242/g.37755  ORF Transcript_18242/g.37755 Transcript_18242/m.37755 type:complete len:203 (-) Transcript_18242:8-616(-)